MELANNHYYEPLTFWDELEYASQPPKSLGFIDGVEIYEGDSTHLCCLFEDRDLEIYCMENEIPF